MGVVFGCGGGDVAHPVQHQPGTVGEAADHLPVGDPGEHQGGVQAALNARHNVGVHPVADDGGVLGVDPQHVEPRAHHQGVGLSHVVGGGAGGQLDGSHQGPAGGDDARLRGAGQVGVGADEPGALPDALDRPADVVIGVAEGLAYNYIVRVVFVKGDPLLIEGVEQPRLPDDEGLGPGHLGGHKLGGGQGAGVKMLFVDVQPHLRQLLLKLPLGFAAVVGEE